MEEGTALAASLPQAVYIQADCSTHEGCDSLVKEVIGRCGRLDLLVCSLAKGQGTPSPICIPYQLTSTDYIT